MSKYLLKTEHHDATGEPCVKEIRPDLYEKVLQYVYLHDAFVAWSCYAATTYSRKAEATISFPLIDTNIRTLHMEAFKELVQAGVFYTKYDYRTTKWELFEVKEEHVLISD